MKRGTPDATKSTNRLVYYSIYFYMHLTGRTTNTRYYGDLAVCLDRAGHVPLLFGEGELEIRRRTNDGVKGGSEGYCWASRYSCADITGFTKRIFNK